MTGAWRHYIADQPARPTTVDPPHSTCIEVMDSLEFAAGRRSWLCGKDCPGKIRGFVFQAAASATEDGPWQAAVRHWTPRGFIHRFEMLGGYGTDWDTAAAAAGSAAARARLGVDRQTQSAPGSTVDKPDDR